DFSRDLERRYQSEQERIEQARTELEQLKSEHERAEEARQLREEEMYAAHEQHRADIEDQKHQLLRLVEENERAREKAKEELQLAREIQKHLDGERQKLREQQKLEQQQQQQGSQGSISIQTDPLCTTTTCVGSDDGLSSGHKEMGVGPNPGVDEEDGLILAKDVTVFREGRKVSTKEQLAELDQEEFSRRMSYRETEESLAFQQEDIEDSYGQTQQQIQARIRKIQEMEEEYKELDKAHLQDITT
ncbi:hypothetical protein MAR_002233, partial [Mya arenaria]